ncbi:hypothetical protein BT67DRAFT_441572 [Trichocladium antarcticum]|uniref:SnoaL-like domain-containing protein n=1 Tax=Trichocladium antarcticum TaxID=1450529 RepID=A0AAN6ZDK3_9PEZI|nr:hypothetical protein BT67DRAFT_441572 [Trichocladium antarcticum]
MHDTLTPTRLRTVQALLQSYSTLSADRILEHVSEDFKQEVLPTRIDKPVLDRASFGRHATSMFALFDDFCMDPQTIYEDEGLSAIVVYVHISGRLREDETRWRSECIMIVRLSGDGTKVVQLLEYVEKQRQRS